MTDRLDEAIARIRELPGDLQEEAAEMLLAFAEPDQSEYRLTAGQVAEVRRRLAEPPDYVPDAELEETLERLTR
jgi:hypothetical protein